MSRSRPWTGLAGLALGAALALGACASLETDIRLFDDSCLSDEAIVAARAEQVRGLLAQGAFERAQQSLMDEADAAWKASGLPEDARGPYDAELEGLGARLRQAEDANRKGLDGYDAGQPRLAQQYFLQANGFIEEARARYDETIGAIFDGGEVDLAGVDAAFARAQRELVGGEMFDDPRLAMVLYATAEERRSGSARALEKAAEGCWSARIDHTRTVANAGNADIAVTMRDDGTFTVKGMRLDASQITQAFAKLSTQAVCLAASFSGVPGCPMAGGPNSASPSAGEEGFDTAAAQAEMDARKRAALLMLEEIVEQDATVRKQPKTAAVAVTQTIDANLPALEATLAGERPSSK